MLTKNIPSLILLLLACAIGASSAARHARLKGVAPSLRRVIKENEESETEEDNYYGEEEEEDLDATGEDLDTSDEETLHESQEEEDEEDAYDETEVEEFKPDERECTISEDDDEVEFECEAKSEGAEGKIKDEIDFEIKTTKKDGLKIKVKYEQEIDMDAAELESETQYEILFDKIIEYEKATNDTDQSYEWGVDTVVQELPLTSWQDFSPVVTDADGIVSTFFVITEDGIATFTFTISRADMSEGLTANKMKIDVRITSFPWNSTGTSYVALISSVESTKEVEVEYDEDESDSEDTENTTSSKTALDVIIPFDQGVDETGIQPFGEYTWANTAEATLNDTLTNTSVSFTRSLPVMVQVVATSPPLLGNETFQSIAFSFVGEYASGASDIYWDPEAGIGYKREATGEGSNPTGTMTSDAASLGLFSMVVSTILSSMVVMTM